MATSMPRFHSSIFTKRHSSLFLALSLLICAGCGDGGWLSSWKDGDANDAATNVAGDSGGQLSENESGSSVAITNREIRVRQRLGQLFETVVPKLEQALGLVDQHADLPDNSLIPFKVDKQSNSAEINALLDQAIEALNVSEVSDYRQRIRDANDAIAESQQEIADYRRQRISADKASEQSQIDKVNPFVLSKEGIDEAIESEREKITEQEQLLVTLKKSFADELSKIGVEVDDAGVESLLSSVSGDDIVTMAVVFENIKRMTTQLQTLTEESSEALDVSKRYYGLYVVMLQTMDRIQKTFVRDVNDRHIPKLKEFSESAKVNIRQARALMKVNGGDKDVLLANVRSNQLTMETAELYIEYLQRNAALIANENKFAQKKIATAMNTYDTVKLSSDVAALMNTGRRDFETLMRLKVPSLREFGNDAIRKEFQRMTSELRASR